MKIDFDVYFISQCVGAKCSDPSNCKETALCVTCSKVNFFLAIPLTMNILFKVIAAPKLYRELNPGKGIHPVSLMFVIASLYACLMYCDAMFDPSQKMNSNGQQQWHKQVKQKRIVGRTMWEEGREAFQEKLKRFQQSPTPVDPIEFIRFMEERLYGAKAIFDVVNGDTRDIHDKDAVDWFKALRKEGKTDSVHWTDGQKWMMKKFGTINLPEWTKEMEVCEADNVVHWQKEVDRFNNMRVEITNRIKDELALEDEAKKFDIVGKIVAHSRKGVIEAKEKRLASQINQATTVQRPPSPPVEEEESEGEEEEGPKLPKESMGRIARHLALATELELDTKPANYDILKEVYGKEKKQSTCTVVEMPDGHEEEEEEEGFEKIN